MYNESICLITFSNNSDHQNVIYSLFNSLKNVAQVYTIGITNPKTSIAPHTDKNFYFDCPLRPGIEKKTFRIDILIQIANTIKKHNIKYLYFETQHIWDAFLMLLCPKCIKVVAVHDVIPHDGNRCMELSNYVTCKLADHIILKNNKFINILAEKYNININKITCFRPWRDFPDKTPVANSKRFLFFGRIRKYKGMDSLLEIIKRTPYINYDVVGSPDKDSLHIVDEIKKCPNINVCDREISENEMKQYFENSDWVVLPYSSATQSGVILDAYRFSRPVIAFDVGAISEQIVDGKTGFLVENNNIDSFVNTIKKVNNFSKEILEEFSTNAYEYGLNKYAATAIYNDFKDTLLAIKK